MGVPTIKTGPMTVEEFYAFTDMRPDEEKWELIDGEPVLNASPSELHQRIIKNLSFALTTLERQPGTAWEILPGLGVRVSETSRPEPDVLIIFTDDHFNTFFLDNFPTFAIGIADATAGPNDQTPMPRYNVAVPGALAAHPQER